MEIAYRAYDVTGRVKAGTIDAASETEALDKLSELGLHPVAVGPATKNSVHSWLSYEIGRATPSLRQQNLFLHMLSSLLSAGIPIDAALRAIQTSNAGKNIAVLAGSTLKLVNEGKPLSSALGENKSGLGPLEIGLIKSGEQSGQLSKSLESLSREMSKRLEVRSKIISAMTYPIVLIFMAILSLTVIVSVLVPGLAPLFEQSAQRPPVIISIFMTLRKVILGHGWLILAVVILIAYLSWLALKRPSIKARTEAIWFKLPLARKRESALICRTLSLLLGNGMPVQHAIRFTADVCRSERTRNELRVAHDNVVSGAGFHAAMRGVKIFEQADLQLIGIGEKTNKLDTMLAHVAKTLDGDADQLLERMMTLLTPLATLAMGGLIAGLIMSVMSAILSVNALVSP